MTVKEIANFAGKAETTVTRWIKKAKMQNADSKMQNADFGSYGHDYTIAEVETILKASSLSKDAVSIIMQNARENAFQESAIELYAKETLLLNKNVVNSLLNLQLQVTELFSRVANLERPAIEEKPVVEEKFQNPFPEIPPRQSVNIIVRQYAKDSGEDYKVAWVELYNEFANKTNIDVRRKAINKKMTILDYIDSEGLMDVLAGIAGEFFCELKKAKDVC